MSTIIFVIPNRTDATKRPTLYEEWAATCVPREGETVYLPDGESEDGRPWIVKWVRHTFVPGAPQKIEVRLIEPNHWLSKDTG